MFESEQPATKSSLATVAFVVFIVMLVLLGGTWYVIRP
jgi:hypothetical protein